METLWVVDNEIILQILVLSSNTKKGEIERTFPKFCVLGNNTSDLSNDFGVVGHCYYKSYKGFNLPSWYNQKGKKRIYQVI